MDNIITILIPALVIVAVVAFAIILMVKGETNKLKQLALYLVTMMEKEYGSGTGAIKFSAVAEALYAKLPSFIGMFISAKTIETIIEWAVVEMKKFLAENEEVSARLLNVKTKKVTTKVTAKTLEKA